MVGSSDSSCRYKRLLCQLGCSGQQSTKNNFPAVYYFNLRVPIAQQPGQAVGQGRLSLSQQLRWADWDELAKVRLRRPDFHPKVGEIFGLASSGCTRFHNWKKRRLSVDHTRDGECALLLTQRREGERVEYTSTFLEMEMVHCCCSVQARFLDKKKLKYTFSLLWYTQRYLKLLTFFKKYADPFLNQIWARRQLGRCSSLYSSLFNTTAARVLYRVCFPHSWKDDKREALPV